MSVPSAPPTDPPDTGGAEPDGTLRRIDWEPRWCCAICYSVDWCWRGVAAILIGAVRSDRAACRYGIGVAYLLSEFADRRYSRPCINAALSWLRLRAWWD
jgi:hypothetical protein